MILIISEAENKSTDQVFDWLHYHGKRIIRINSTCKFFTHKAVPDFYSCIVCGITDSEKINSSDIKSYWHRWRNQKLTREQHFLLFLKPGFKKFISAYLQYPDTAFRFFLFQNIQNKISDVSKVKEYRILNGSEIRISVKDFNVNRKKLVFVNRFLWA